MSQKKAIIIGSGVGGMAAAIRLTIQGFNVSVFEKNNYPGGKLTGFEKDGFHFDAGPSLFTQPQNIKELFELANEPIEDYFSYQPVHISCKYFYENGKVIHAYSDIAEFENELVQQANEQTGAVKKYLANAEQLYNNIGSIFLDYSLHKSKTWFNKKIMTALKTVRFNYLFKTLHKHNAVSFTSAEAIQLFDRYATYNGSNPYKAPGMLSLIPHLEQNQGTFYPKGGMISITNALYQLAKKKGVEFYFNTAVEKILSKGKMVTGIRAADKTFDSDIVVSNSDVYFTYKDLLLDKAKAKKILQQERSSSAIIFYWGIKKEFKDLSLHNIFFSENYQKEFECLFKTQQPSDDPTVYINITSKMEEGLAPPGKENWFVMVNAPANNGQDWEKIKKDLKRNILAKLKRMLGEDIETLIETEHTLNPVQIEAQTASYMGSLYGTSSNSKFAAFLRHPNFTSRIKGLYFCGGSVHPGGGIPLCLKSAKIVSNLVAGDFKK